MKKLLVSVCLTLAFCLAAFAQSNIRKIDFQNFTYDADYCGGEGERKITVKDGKFFEEKKVDDYTERMFFSIYDVAFGDLDGDRSEEAIVLSICNMGGTGNFSEAYIYKWENGKPVRKMTLIGGDRAFGGLRRAWVEKGLLIVESNDAGKYGGACCAEYAVKNTYRFNGKVLKEVGKSSRRELYPAKRIAFERGKFGKNISVKMAPNEQRKRFVVGAAAGQTLMVTNKNPNLKLRLRRGDADVLEEDTSLVAKLKKSGDYVFEVNNFSDKKQRFSILVTIKDSEYNYVNASTNKIESVYTDLNADKCKTVELDETGAGYYRGECKGVGGYKLEIIEGDIRQTINVIHGASGNKWELDFLRNVSSGFSSVGEKAEWRVKQANGRVTPIALIVRYNVSVPTEDGNQKTKSSLIVTKFDGEFICITDVVSPMRKQNEKARELADVAASKPCLAKS